MRYEKLLKNKIKIVYLKQFAKAILNRNIAYPGFLRLPTRIQKDFIDYVWEKNLIGPFCNAPSATKRLENEPKRCQLEILFCLSEIPVGKTKMHGKAFASTIRSIRLALPEARLGVLFTGELQLIKVMSGCKTLGAAASTIESSKKHLEECLNEFLMPSEINQIRILVHRKKPASLMSFYKNAYDEIDLISPDVIVFFSGAPQESVNLRRLSHMRYPVIVKLTQDHAPAPKHADGIWHWSGSSRDNLGERQLEFFMRTPWLLKNSEISSWKFSDQRNSSSVYNVATILGGNRIQKLLASWPERRWKQFAEVLVQHRVLWNFVGCTDPEAVEGLLRTRLPSDAIGKISVVGVTPRIDEFIKNLTLLVNLPGLGGGGGTSQIAVRQGVPILCGSRSDMAKNVHLSFEQDDNGYSEMYRCLSCLLGSEKERNEWAKAQLKAATSVGSEEYHQGLRNFVLGVLHQR